MLEKIQGTPAQFGVGFDLIVDAIIYAVNLLMSTVVSALATVVTAIFSGISAILKELLTLTPYPKEEGSLSPKLWGPPEGSRTLDGAWNAFYGLHDTLTNYAYVLLFLAVLVVLFSGIFRSFEGLRINTEKAKRKLLLGFLFITLWWPIMTLILAFTDAAATLLETSVNSEYITIDGEQQEVIAGIRASDGFGVKPIVDEFGQRDGEWPALLVLVIVEWVATITLAIIALPWVVRVFLLLVGAGTMPIAIAFWAFGDIPFFKQFSSIGKKHITWYFKIVLVAIPGAIIAGVGKTLLKIIWVWKEEGIGDSTTSNGDTSPRYGTTGDTEALTNPQAAESVGGAPPGAPQQPAVNTQATQGAFGLDFASDIVTSVIIILLVTTVPLLAGVVPWALVIGKSKAANLAMTATGTGVAAGALAATVGAKASGKAGSKAGSKVRQKASEKSEKARERYGGLPFEGGSQLSEGLLNSASERREDSALRTLEGGLGRALKAGGPKNSPFGRAEQAGIAVKGTYSGVKDAAGTAKERAKENRVTGAGAVAARGAASAVSQKKEEYLSDVPEYGLDDPETNPAVQDELDQQIVEKYDGLNARTWAQLGSSERQQIRSAVLDSMGASGSAPIDEETTPTEQIDQGEETVTERQEGEEAVTAAVEEGQSVRIEEINEKALDKLVGVGSPERAQSGGPSMPGELPDEIQRALEQKKKNSQRKEAMLPENFKENLVSPMADILGAQTLRNAGVSGISDIAVSAAAASKLGSNVLDTAAGDQRPVRPGSELTSEYNGVGASSMGEFVAKIDEAQQFNFDKGEVDIESLDVEDMELQSMREIVEGADSMEEAATEMTRQQEAVLQQTERLKDMLNRNKEEFVASYSSRLENESTLDGVLQSSIEAIDNPDLGTEEARRNVAEQMYEQKKQTIDDAAEFLTSTDMDIASEQEIQAASEQISFSNATTSLEGDVVSDSIEEAFKGLAEDEELVDVEMGSVEEQMDELVELNKDKNESMQDVLDRKKGVDTYNTREREILQDTFEEILVEEDPNRRRR